MILLNYENVHFSLGYVNNAMHIDLNFDIAEEFIESRNNQDITDNIEKDKKFEISEFFDNNKLLNILNLINNLKNLDLKKILNIYKSLNDSENDYDDIYYYGISKFKSICFALFT